MSISNIRIKRKQTHTAVANTAILDPRLSLKAKGLLLVLLAHPDGTDITMEGLIGQSADGRTSVRSAIKELEGAGYLRREKVKDDQGRFSGWDWFVTDMAETRPTENLHLGEAAPVDNSKAETENTEQDGISPDRPETRRSGFQSLGDSKNNLSSCVLEVTGVSLTDTPPPQDPPLYSPPLAPPPQNEPDPFDFSRAQEANSGGMALLPSEPQRYSAAPAVDNLPPWLPPELWAEWEEHRREIRKPLKPKLRQRQLRDLQKWADEFGEEAARESIQTSLRNGWVGLFPPKRRRGRGAQTFNERRTELLQGVRELLGGAGL